jgi:hypothetical protein
LCALHRVIDPIYQNVEPRVRTGKLIIKSVAHVPLITKAQIWSYLCVVSCVLLYPFAVGPMDSPLAQIGCFFLNDDCPAPCRALGLLILFAAGCLAAITYLFSVVGPMPGGIMLAGAVPLVIFLYVCAYNPYQARQAQRRAEASRQQRPQSGHASWDRPKSKFGNLTAAPDEVACGHPVNKSLTAPWHPSNAVITPDASDLSCRTGHGSSCGASAVFAPAWQPVIPYYPQPGPNEEASPRLPQQQWPHPY